MNRAVFSRLKKVAKLILIFCLIIFPAFGAGLGLNSCRQNYNVVKASDLKGILKDFFGVKEEKSEQAKKEPTMVYVGGRPLGFTLECDGVMVVAVGSVETAEGERRPCEGKNIKVGDVIKTADGQKVTRASQFQEVVNNSASGVITLEIERGGEKFIERVTAKLEASTNTLRLGLWIRDNAAGVGTLTYVREDNLRFGALGHSVTDIDTNIALPVGGGNIYKCSIVGLTKGTRGTPGELRGLFLRKGEEAGELDSNNEVGVYGTINQKYLLNNPLSLMEVGSRDEVKTGKATIRCTVDGSEPSDYDIEIVKLTNQTTSGKKSMVIKVVDPRLIEKTGGIVQGMSGSPIIQNNKLVGAVTHVFVSDPTKGFGVYIDWMIDN